MHIFRVQWTIVSRTAPQPWIKCSRCGVLKPFRSSGRTRLNANGKTLDAWLIYKCTSCDNTWNRPILERLKVRDLEASVLQALQSANADWLRDFAFDVASLRQRATRIDEFADVEVLKSVKGDAPEDWTSLDIELIVPRPVNLRLDRLLSMELELPRARLRALQSGSLLHVAPPHKNALRRPARHGQCVRLAPLDESDVAALRRSAAGRRI